MAFAQYRIEANDGSIIIISSRDRAEHLVKIGEIVDPVTQEVRDNKEMQYVEYYSVGIGQPSSVLNIPTNLTICPYTLEDYLPRYTNPKSEEYFSSDTYATIKSACDACAYWVWGGYDVGGMVALRTGNDNVQIAVMEGFYRIGENRYCFSQNYRDLTIEQTQNLTIHCATNNQDMFFSYSQSPITVLTPTKNFVGVVDYYEAIESYDNIIKYTWREASQQVGITKQTIGDDMPSYVWQNAPVMLHITDFPVEEYELIYGNFWGNAQVDEDGNPFIDGGVTGDDGGWGGYPSQSDRIPTTNPENFAVDVVTSGLLTLYKPTPAQINQFQNFLFGGITDSMSNQLKKLTSDPLQYLLFVAMVHYSPEGNVGQEIGYAGIGTGVYATKINKQYKQIDCGTITIPEASKSFLDYGSYSKVSIYLPYVGVEHLNIDDVMGADVHVVYNINQLDGSCVVQVECNRQKRIKSDTPISAVLYHFNGNCFTTIPMFATDWRGALSSAVSLIGGVGSIATGNVAGAVGSLASAVSQEKVTLKRSSSGASNYGYMDNQHPYLILERPITNIPLNYGKYEGYTTNITYKIASLKGYTEIDTDDIYINYFNGITNEEFNELKELLNGGIYL